MVGGGLGLAISVVGLALCVVELEIGTQRQRGFLTKPSGHMMRQSAAAGLRPAITAALDPVGGRLGFGIEMVKLAIGTHWHGGTSFSSGPQAIGQIDPIGFRFGIGLFELAIETHLHGGSNTSSSLQAMLQAGGEGSCFARGTHLHGGSNTSSSRQAISQAGPRYGWIGAQPHGGTGVVPGTQTIPHLVGGGLGFAIKALELAIGTQLHGNTSFRPNGQKIRHLGTGVGSGMTALELDIGAQPHGGTGVVPGKQTLKHTG